ncbi:MAG: hypothetical protein ACR2MG_06235 [Pyrinomonadaceae bacterium]
MTDSEKNIREEIDVIKWRDRFAFECGGIKVGVKINDLNVKSKLKKVLPVASREIDFGEADEILMLVVGENRRVNGLYYKYELIHQFDDCNDALLNLIGDKILMFLALISLPRILYLHAGAVSWNNTGIILPGGSFSGKTTLVKEFIKAGADYITDDLTLLDIRGNILPFPRALAIRTKRGREIKTADCFGAKTVAENVKLKLILFTEFEENARWKPEILPPGQAVLRLMNNFYYKPSVREAPMQILRTLAGITDGIKIYAGKRGNAKSVINWVVKNF